MTDDLVKRLREEQAWGNLLDGRAANRIEELEARLKRTENLVNQYEHWVVQIRSWIKTGEVPSEK